MNRFLEEAFSLAVQGVGQVSPNPAVGAVIVRDAGSNGSAAAGDGEVAGRGFHTWAGMKHAEVLAIEQAGDRARGATLYLTLEPCSHQGRTSPCAAAIIAAGIKKVVAATEDPNPQVRGSGFALLRKAGVQVEIDPDYAARAEELNPAFFHFMRTGLPLVTLKAAVTLDGKIGAPEDAIPGSIPGWITSEAARAHVQVMRHRSDAILTGIGTVLADDCKLTDRTGESRSRPLLRIIVDSLLRTPVESKMVAAGGNDLMIVTTSAASTERRQRLASKGVRIEVLEAFDGRTDLSALVALLAREKYQSLMIEGGSRINWSVLESGVADKIFFYYAPKILGGSQSLPVAGGTGRRRRADAILFRDVKLHTITPTEFAVEAYLVK